MKVKSTRSRTISIHVYCRVCDFQIFTEAKTNCDFSYTLNKARNHVAKTGHEVEIFTEKFCVYKPVEVTP